MNDEESSKLNVLIVGAAHSGSTLLDLLLGGHSDAWPAGELSFLPYNYAQNTSCSCGELMAQCKIWSPIGTRLQESLGIDIWRDPYGLSLGYIRPPPPLRVGRFGNTYLIRRKVVLGGKYWQRRLGISMFRVAERHFDAVANARETVCDLLREETGSKHIIDSSKNYMYAYEQCLRYPETTRVILLVRDGRGVFHSHLKRGWSQRSAMRAWRSFYTHAFSLFNSVSNAQKYELRYEELVSNVDGSLKDLCAWLGIGFEDKMKSGVHEETHIANGNKFRYTGKAEIRLDERWRSECVAQDKAYFDRFAAPLNERLGYSRDW